MRKRNTSKKKLEEERCCYFARDIRCPRRIVQKGYCGIHKEPKVFNIPSEDCPICTEKRDGLRWFDCDHGLCQKCLVQLCSTTCPFCREPLWTDKVPNCIDKNERRVILKNIERKERADEEQQRIELRERYQNAEYDSEDSFDIENFEEESMYESELRYVLHRLPIQSFVEQPLRLLIRVG